MGRSLIAIVLTQEFQNDLSWIYYINDLLSNVKLITDKLPSSSAINYVNITSSELNIDLKKYKDWVFQ